MVDTSDWIKRMEESKTILEPLYMPTEEEELLRKIAEDRKKRRERREQRMREEKAKCIHCGQPIQWEDNEALWTHRDHNRWTGDNGYWCYPDSNNYSATGEKND